MSSTGEVTSGDQSGDCKFSDLDAVEGRLTMREWKMRHDVAEMEDAGVQLHGKPLVYILAKFGAK